MVRAILVMTVMGCLVSSEQVRCESVFDAPAARVQQRIVLSPALPHGAAAGGLGMSLGTAAAADTLETIEVEVEEAKGRSRYKELAAVVIVAAVATYAAITLLRPDDEEVAPAKGGGKEVPERAVGFSFCLPFTR